MSAFGPQLRFPTETEAQWLEIDLEKVCQVDAVRIKWWGTSFAGGRPLDHGSWQWQVGGFLPKIELEGRDGTCQ